MSPAALLEKQSSVREYLAREVFPGLAPPPYGPILTTSLSRQKPVFLFRERNRRIAVVGKSFLHDSVSPEEAWENAEREYLNLRLLRERFGMNGGCCEVVAPLGMNRELGATVFMEWAPGRPLDHYVAAAVQEQRFQALYDRLGLLARFFSRLHGNSQSDRLASPADAARYLKRLLESLGRGPLGDFNREAIERYSSRLWDTPGLPDGDREVMVHGDATPTNFLFHHGTVRAIDLERMKWGDRCWDLGFMAAELKHHFMWRSGNGWAAEPFIGHFLWEYSVNHRKGGGTQTFHQITGRLPLYMALGLMRIARNEWLDLPHRQNLMREAKRCLKYGPSSSTTTARS